MSTRATVFISSPERCCTLPFPGEAKVKRPGFAFASPMSSFTDRACTEGCTTRMSGVNPASVTGARSLSGS